MVAVLGAGSWGTTLAAIIASSGNDVDLWARNEALVEYMRDERHNPQYVTDLALPEGVHPTSDLEGALEDQDMVIHVVPSHATRDFASRYAPYLPQHATLVSATKGLEPETHKRMTDVIKEETGVQPGLVTGPNHAEEVSREQPTAAVAAHPSPREAREMADVLSTKRFKVYPRTDLVGSEVCSAYKNVVALSSGMASGLGYGDNAQAALVTLGIDEMVAFVRRLGGAERTSYGLAGLGDLVATATSTHSRNRHVGEELAKGRQLESILDDMGGQVAEGVRAVKAFHAITDEEQLDLPLTRVSYQVVYEGMTVEEGVAELLRQV
jgi:glycerol-3-phosphate dehydrogenase (NAD(P)+)